MQIIFSIARYITLLLLSGYLSYYVAIALVPLYKWLFPYGGGAFDISLEGIAVLLIGLGFLIPLLLLTLGDKYRYRVAAPISLVLLLYIFNLDFKIGCFSLACSLLGAGVGWVLRFGMTKVVATNDSLVPLKKYF